MKTLEDLRQRCLVNDDGCWIWKGDRYSSGQPRVVVEGRRRGPAKHLAQALAGKPRPKKYGTCRCALEPVDCINPHHLMNLTRSQVIEASNRDNMAAHLVRHARSRAAQRAASDVMTMDLAREIRGSVESGAEIARRLNLPSDYINQIRRGRLWQEPCGPWSGMGAR